MLALLSHCHKRGITHTDLKLTSICYNSKRQDVLKVMDFSISKIFRVEEVVDQSIGRAVLSAPETVSGQTSSKSDIWSCGIILYILLCGEPPIIANTRARLIHKYKSCNSFPTQSSCASDSAASGTFPSRRRRWYGVCCESIPTKGPLQMNSWRAGGLQGTCDCPNYRHTPSAAASRNCTSSTYTPPHVGLLQTTRGHLDLLRQQPHLPR